jgi:phosphoribosylformylglycinamidine (FGAM) synthase PurS component
MQHVKLYVYAKNLDLHCISAREAIRQFLGVEDMSQLRRFQKWELDFDVATPEEAKEQVEMIVSKTYQLLNQNKEGYYVDVLPKPSYVQSNTVVVDVVRNIGTDDASVAESIRQKTGAKLKEARHSVVWEVTLDQASASAGNAQEYIQENIVVTSAQDKGVLVNPLFESFEFLDLATVYGE